MSTGIFIASQIEYKMILTDNHNRLDGKNFMIKFSKIFSLNSRGFL